MPASGVGQHAGTPGEHHRNLQHEIKTPLTLVKNYMDEYIVKNLKSEELDIIKGGVDKLVRDVVNLFDVNRFAKGIGVYNHNEITDFSIILGQDIIFFEHYSALKKITCKKDIEDNIFIKADSNAINRVINNIIENAIKYSTEGDTITVSLNGVEDKILFIVEDTGIGIAPENQRKVFEPYYQISHKTTCLQGMGLGLPIVKKIVDSLKGDISIKSNPSLTRGTKVIITLNRYILQMPDSPNKNSKRLDSMMYNLFSYDLNERTYDKEKKTILLIEDSKSMLRFLFNKLSDKYNVLYAFDGVGALKLLKEKTPTPDLILSDIMMDKIDGFNFAKAITDQDMFNYIPIIFLTAKASPSDMLDGYNSGAIDFIRKPFSFTLLSLKIENILNTIARQHQAMINQTLSRFGYKNNSHQNNYIEFDKISKLYKLTNREKEIAALLKQGKSYKQIAETLYISEKTVNKHIQNTFEKTDSSNKIELINKLFSTSL